MAVEPKFVDCLDMVKGQDKSAKSIFHFPIRFAIAKKNNIRIAKVIDAVITEPIPVSHASKVSSNDSNNNWIPNKAKAATAYSILLRPVFLYAEIDNANNKSEKTPVTAIIIVSTLSNS